MCEILKLVINYNFIKKQKLLKLLFMKRINLITITLLVTGVVIIAISAVSCKKDKLTEPLEKVSDEFEYDTQTKKIVQRIKKFDEQIKNVKQGLYKRNELVDIDSALWNIESLFNATYSSPDEYYVDKRICEISIGVNMSDANQISIEEACRLYDNIMLNVRDAYREDGIDSNKGIMSIFVGMDDGDSRTHEVKVVVVTGKTAHNPNANELFLNGPFEKDACWYYGELGGSCDNPDTLYDAAELIEDAVNYYHGYKPEKNPYCRNVYVNMACIALAGNEYLNGSNQPYIFYKENCPKEELYLDGNDMNYYYHNEVHVISNLVPKDPKYTQLFTDETIFMEVNVDGTQAYSNDVNIHKHDNYIFYGSRYSVTKDEFGAVKNLLNN